MAVVDEVVPIDFTTLFRNEDVHVAGFPEEWKSVPDGGIIRVAIAADYDWLITCDKQMPYQQNLSGKSLAVTVLPTPQILKLEQIRPALLDALRKPTPGCFVILDDEGKQATDPLPHMSGRTRKRK
jgi:hypothetical protein